MKVDINLERQDTEEYASQLQQQIQKDLSNYFEKGISFDTVLIKEILQESINSIITKKLEPFVKKVLDKFVEEVDFAHQQIINEHREINKIFLNENDLAHLSIMFMDKVVSIKRNAEDIVTEYYKKKDFNVIPLNKALYFQSHFSKSLKKVINLIKEDRTGMPDLLIYQTFSNNFFLVEVKTNGDGIRANQMLWYKTHPNIKTQLIFVNQIKKLDDVKDET